MHRSRSSGRPSSRSASSREDVECEMSPTLRGHPLRRPIFTDRGMGGGGETGGQLAGTSLCSGPGRLPGGGGLELHTQGWEELDNEEEEGGTGKRKKEE